MFIRLEYFLLLLVLISTCGCNKHSDAKHELIFTPIDTFFVGGITDGYPTPEYFIEKNSNKECLVFCDKRINTLIFYDLVSGSIQKQIKLPFKVWEIFVHSIDSIFVLERTDNPMSVKLIDREGNIKNFWNIENSADEGSYYFASYQSNPILYKNGLLIVGNYINTTAALPNEKARKEFYGATCCRVIDTRDSLAKQVLVGRWPKIYVSYDFQNYDPHWDINQDNNIVLSFGVTDSLYIFKPPYREVHSIYSASSYKKDVRPFPSDSITHFAFVSKYAVTEFRYLRILYDPYRKLYLRIVGHSQKYENTDGSLNAWIDRSWSVMVYNSDLNLLAEIPFEAKKFDLRDIFVTKKGLLVSANHPENPLFSTKSTPYVLFNISYGINS